MKIEDTISSGSVSVNNIRTLQEYAKKVSLSMVKPIVVDIGTSVGTSAIALALAMPHIRVLTVDPNYNGKSTENFKGMGVADRITYFQMTSEEFSKTCPLIEMCFIDGEHSYAGVKRDIEGIVKKVRRGGYVLFHDRNLYFNSVGKAIEEYEDELYAFIKETDGRIEDPKEGSVYVGRIL